MSAIPENEFDLEKLFLPAWAQEPASTSQYAKYQGEERPHGKQDRRDRPMGRRPGREQRPGARGQENRGRGDRRPPSGEQKAGNERVANQRGRGPGPGERGQWRQPQAPLPEIDLSFIPEEKGVESLARQIKMTGRAYPLFDIAQMILQKPERQSVVFSVTKTSEGQPIQPLFVCALDETLWLSEDEAVAHVLKHHFGTFYQAERTATEPPKGKYTFVAQCGLSGVILGPPNYHDYQNQLRKLHTERFSRMPFETYKSRVKIVRDEEVVKKWIDDQSWKTEFTCLNMPEPLRLASMEEVEKHFRENHKVNIIKKVESHTLGGAVARGLRSSELVRLVRQVWEDQRRFPLQIATVLSQQFAALGLQFFKVNRTITHVCVARPHYLDLQATPVSEGVKRIVDFISGHPKSNRRLLVEALAPSPVASGPESAPATASAAQPQRADPTSEQTAVISDLHWLIHQGHVIEFANGILELAKRPLPRPPKPEPVPASKTQESVPQAEPVSQEPAVSESTPEIPAPAESASLESAESSPETPGAPPGVSAESTAGETPAPTPGETPAESAPVPVETSS